MAVFTLRIDPTEDFTTILQQGRIGESGETYAFNKQGLLISNSRFDDQLRRVGLIFGGQGGMLNVAIRDPGGNLLKGEGKDKTLEEQPLTRMAGNAVERATANTTETVMAIMARRAKNQALNSP